MDDWTYCQQTLPKVSRTFALNIKTLQGEQHRSVLIAYLFCRTVDTVVDAAELDPKIKIELAVKDSLVDSVVEAIRSVSNTGKVGDGKIFVLNVEDAIRIRTGEKGDEAVNVT